MPKVRDYVPFPGASKEGIYDSITEGRVGRCIGHLDYSLDCLSPEHPAREGILRVREQLKQDEVTLINGNGGFRDDVPYHVKAILEHLDPEPDREGLDDTPDRVARMYLEELCSGYDVDMASLLRTFPNEGYDGMIVVQGIPMTSLCEHHLVPFVGYAHVGYFPNGRVVGLSKVARVVQAYARRLQVQERLTKQICHVINEHLNPRGVMVILEAEHLCMTIRGVQAPGTRTITSAVTGLYNENKEGEKEEFLRLIGKE